MKYQITQCQIFNISKLQTVDNVKYYSTAYILRNIRLIVIKLLLYATGF